jgi:hypothetical protein
MGSLIMKKLVGSKISDDDISALINNGFDFLERAREDFKMNPKHAVASF